MLARPLVGVAAEEVAVSATVVVSVQRQAEELAALVSAGAVHAQAELRLLHGVDAGLAAECLVRLVTFAAAATARKTAAAAAFEVRRAAAAVEAAAREIAAAVPRAEATSSDAGGPACPAAGTAPAFNYPVS